MQWDDETARKAKEQAELDRARRMQRERDSEFVSQSETGSGGGCLIALILFFCPFLHRWLVSN
jgi:hypothetical protein